MNEEKDQEDLPGKRQAFARLGLSGRTSLERQQERGRRHFSHKSGEEAAMMSACLEGKIW